MTFSTFVTPTRDSDTWSVGRWAWTSSSAIVVGEPKSDIRSPFRLAIGPDLDEKATPSVRTDRNSRGTKLGRGADSPNGAGPLRRVSHPIPTRLGCKHTTEGLRVGHQDRSTASG